MGALFRMIISFILFLLTLLGLRLLLGGARRAARSRDRKPGGDGRAQENGSVTRGTLVKDPQCGILVDPEIARTARIGGETCYFCSPECLEAYRKEHRG